MTNAKRNAFIKGIESGKFNTDKAKIYKLLENKPMKLKEIVACGFLEKTASARLSDLMDLGVVKSDNNPIISTFLIVTDPVEQTNLVQSRYEKQHAIWIAKGIEMGWLDGDGNNAGREL